MKNNNNTFKNNEKFTVIEEMFFFLHTWFFIKPEALFTYLKEKIKINK
jgi:hypothetical protein